MKKLFPILFLFLVSFFGYSQVGINTTDPQASLDVREANPASPTAAAGIAIPQVTVLPGSGNRSGQIVLLTTDNKLYYYNGTSWGLIAKNEWTSAGAVTFTALSTFRVAGTAPTVDPDAIMNLREWKVCDDGYIEETIVISSDGTGATAGTGYYIFTPQFNVDTSRHQVYSGNLNVDLTNAPNTFGANIGNGSISHDNSYATAYAIPISTNQIAIGTISGSHGNSFISHVDFNMAVSNWQLKLTIKYKKAP